MTFDAYVRYAGSPENVAREARGGYFAGGGASGHPRRDHHRHIEYPAIYHKGRIRRHQQAARPGESEEQTKERDRREFLALQGSPFFDVWACAGIDETLSALYEKVVVGDS